MITTSTRSQLSPPDQAAVDAIVATIARHLRHEHPRPSRKEPALRDAHPKHHGCVHATFTIEPDLRDELRQGLFGGAAPRTYEAWIRFSNAFKVQHDLDIDARGMAIKLLGVPGEDGESADGTQDFLLVTHKVFFAKDPSDFVDFPAAISGPKTTSARFMRTLGFFFGLKPFRFRWRGFVALQRSMTWATSPLVRNYFSQTPYQFGLTAAKFRARPRQHGSPRQWLQLWTRLAIYWTCTLLHIKMTRWEHSLRDALLEYLDKSKARFDFEVQLHREGMPTLDDALTTWSRWRSPYRKVATITIEQLPKPGDDDVATMMEFGQQLSFTPWHTSQHEPRGSINMARRAVYKAISSLRHQLNHVQRREPRPGESQYAYLRRVGSAQSNPAARHQMACPR